MKISEQYVAVAVCHRGGVEKKTVLENLDLVLLAMDETVDGGCAPALPNPCPALNLLLPHRRRRDG